MQIGGALGLTTLIALTSESSGGLGGTEQAPADGYGQAFPPIALLMVIVAVLAVALPARQDGSPISSSPADEVADGQHVD
ncbi:hypothetical protein [Nonomuraea phyllanthi]|uniref:hypothetical protein n=1 Tax=Nonomuraea phyllanthi TaxID=2219224 RepID=UPI001D143411|nr:hypothetical protein [Nonomuraea phyllanthi]